MSETAWAHLPNAAVIDAVIADTRARPQVWAAAWKEVTSPTWGVLWVAARTAAMAAYTSERWGAMQADARDAVAALTVWPESVALLALTPDALRTIIDTCDGDVKHQAVLLLPAVIARSTV